MSTRILTLIQSPYHIQIAAVLLVCVCAKSLQSCLTLWPCRQNPSRLFCSRDFPGKNTGLGCHILQGISFTQEWTPCLSSALAGGFCTTSTFGKPLCFYIDAILSHVEYPPHWVDWIPIIKRLNSSNKYASRCSYICTPMFPSSIHSLSFVPSTLHYRLLPTTNHSSISKILSFQMIHKLNQVIYNILGLAFLFSLIL